MHIKTTKVLGILSVILGIFFLLNAYTSITGFVIAEKIGKGVSSILGIVFIAVGIGLLSYRSSEAYESRESKLSHMIGKHKWENLSEKDKIAYSETPHSKLWGI